MSLASESKNLTNGAFLPYPSGVMTRFFLPLTLLGCGTTADLSEPTVADPTAAIEASAAIQLDGLVALAEQPAAVLPVDAGCPKLTKLQEDDTALHGRLDGDCTTTAGIRFSGHLEHYEGPDALWLIGSDFQVVDGDVLVFGLDGAIEITPSGSLWLVDVAAAMCGTQSWACEDGVLALDLSYTIFPAAGFPEDYDATVSGTVATERASMTLDGAWSVDRGQCASEPVSGMLSIQRGEHHALTHDGALSCDGCVGWQVQGQDTDGLCGLTD